jgi:oligopeptide/dipeptide ABC transporter ATP-binding protein
MAILEVNELCKHFPIHPGVVTRLLGKGRTRWIKAVEAVSFSVEEGEILGIAGESGCGKSTTCTVVAKLQEPTSGSILYQGRDISTFAGEALRNYRRDVQIIFQDPYESLNPRFRAFDIVAEGPRALKIGDEEEIERRVVAILAQVGLDPREYRDRYPHQMSGGERQRVGIAAALVLEPRLVIADEPLSMLDVSIRAGILDLIRDLSRRLNFTCLYVSHDLSILSNIAHRLMIMYLGQVVEIGGVDRVVREPAHPYTKALISAVPIPDPRYKRPVPDISGDVSRPIDPPPGCRFAARCPKAMDICRQLSPKPVELTDGHRVACHLYAPEGAAA